MWSLTQQITTRFYWLIAVINVVLLTAACTSVPSISAPEASTAKATTQTIITQTPQVQVSVEPTEKPTELPPTAVVQAPTINPIEPPPIPTLTRTPVSEIPYPAPTITPEPTFPFAPTEDLLSTEYGLTWSIPQQWQELSDQVMPPSRQTLYWRAWSDQVEGAAIFSESPPPFPAGLMLLLLDVEPEGASPFPPPNSTPQETHWGNRRIVHVYEVAGEDAAPFSLRLGLSVIRSPYRYNLILACRAAPGEDLAQREALCRNTWRLSRSFGLCAVPIAPAESWRQVSSLQDNYSFEVPLGWSDQHDSSGYRKFLNDPEAFNQPRICPYPNGIMALELYPDAVANRTGATEITVGGRPAWIITRQGEEAMHPLDRATSVYIQKSVSRYYLLNLSCIPPTSADETGQETYWEQCPAILDHILQSFQILPP